VKSEKIERAIALVDPMGLIHMGAPFDEYCSEAREIASILKDGFTDADFLETYLNVMSGSFGKSMTRLNKNEGDDLLHFLRERVVVQQRFRVGDSYKVRNAAFSGAIEFQRQPLKSGEIVTCVGHRSIAGTKDSYVSLMIRGQVFRRQMSHLDESRSRWFLEEVE